MESEKIFKNNFAGEPEKFYWSPGRVNIIGEHSDYHAGFVMPAAIDLGITWSVSKDHDLVSGYTEKFDEIGQFDTRKSDRTHYEWMLYLQGVVEVLKKRGHKIGGVNFAIHSTIPIGSGLSSSSSLATGFAYLLNDLYKLGLDRVELAKVGCEAEWWYGTTGGIMDQFCIANGQAGKAVMLDCRSLTFEYIKIPEDIEIVVFETTIRHKQIDSPFDERKRQAREVLDLAKEYFKNDKIEMLRDMTIGMLDELKIELEKKFGPKQGDLVYRRAKHPITENTRVFKMKEALENDDYKQIGKILYECHESLKNDYEVSCAELDAAVKIGKKIDGIIGSRMIGGGFGGCIINLVKKGTAKHFGGELEEEFRRSLGIKGNAYICGACDGAKEIIR